MLSSFKNQIGRIFNWHVGNSIVKNGIKTTFYLKKFNVPFSTGGENNVKGELEKRTRGEEELSGGGGGARIGYKNHSPQPPVNLIKTMEQYESFVYNKDKKTLVCYYNAQFSTAGKTLYKEYIKLAEMYPMHTFLCVDVDVCPRAAYHGEVVNVPSIVVMRGDDAYKKKIEPLQFTECDHMISTCKNYIDECSKIPEENLKSSTAWYSHNIPLDNLNVHRIDWPTS